MPRPPTDPAVVAQIGDIWLNDTSLTGVQVFEKAQNTVRRCPKIRKVQEIVRDLKKKAQASQVPITDPPVVPWGANWPTEAEEIACLFKLMKTCSDRRIDARVARWGLKLRKIFVGEWEGGFHHLNWASHYSAREKMAEIKGPGNEAFTYDLDWQMMFRPWESPEQLDEYLKSVNPENYDVVRPDPTMYNPIEELLGPPKFRVPDA